MARRSFEKLQIARPDFHVRSWSCSAYLYSSAAFSKKNLQQKKKTTPQPKLSGQIPGADLSIPEFIRLPFCILTKNFKWMLPYFWFGFVTTPQSCFSLATLPQRLRDDFQNLERCHVGMWGGPSYSVSIDPTGLDSPIFCVCSFGYA